MRCELIIKGLESKEQFYENCLCSEQCKMFGDGTIHAIYATKSLARRDEMDLKDAYPNVETEIGTSFDGWVFL